MSAMEIGSSLARHRAVARKEAAPAVAAEGAPKVTQKGLPVKLTQIYADDQFTVLSDVTVSVAQATALAEAMKRAYQFDIKQNHWADTSALTKPIKVELLSDASFFKLTKAHASDTAGWTLDADTFLMPAADLNALTPDNLDTVAHELNHVQDYRIAGAKRKNIPVYMQEGKAYVLGDMYGNAAYLKDVASQVAALTWGQAQASLKDFITDKDENKPTCAQGELVGAAFVEYLRLNVDKDAIAKIATIVSDVGAGKSYASSFAAAFGEPLATAQKSFVDFMKANKPDSKARLAGTIWEPYAP